LETTRQKKLGRNRGRPETQRVLASTKSFDEIKGFLSLQLELRLELGLWLRLTNSNIRLLRLTGKL
jgi:hypothetical protein